MNIKSQTVWMLVLALTVLFVILYGVALLFPGETRSGVFDYFTAKQVQMGRDYSLGPRIVYTLSFLVQAGFLGWLLLGGMGGRLSRACRTMAQGNEWLGFFLFFLALWLLMKALVLPFTYFNGFYWQQQWGFSTQTQAAWFLDYAKESGLDLLLSAVGAFLIYLAWRVWPNHWWGVGAIFFSLWLVVQSLLWPVFIAPLFNRFEPVRNPEITAMVQELAAKADLKIDQILVMDASQRTTKANAYFAGLGQTKRIVLYDTLLNNYPREQIAAVIAHEIAHWQKDHIVKGILLGTLGSFLIWGLSFLALKPMLTAKAYVYEAWPAFLLVVMLLSFASNPLQNAISRQMEYEADRTSVHIIGDTRGAINLQLSLALRNRSDLSPPAFIEWFGYTHPSVLNRIENIKSSANP